MRVNTYTQENMSQHIIFLKRYSLTSNFACETIQWVEAENLSSISRNHEVEEEN